MRWNYIIAGFVLLACGSYIDNCRGLLLPVITRDFQLNYGLSSWFFVAGNFGAVFATFALIPLTQNFSERTVGLGAVLIGILGLLAGGYVSRFSQLMPFAAFVGSVLAVYGALSNLFVIRGTDAAYRSRMMCVLHMMYGFTSLLAPQVTRTLIAAGFPWHFAIAAVVPLLVVILSFILVKIPKEAAAGGIVKQSNRLNRLQVWVVVVFCVYVAGEVLTSMWMVTFLVESEKLSLSTSAGYLSGFFLMMALTRGLCFFSLKPQQENGVLFLCLIISAVMLTLGHRGYYWAFPAAGLLGPFFPLFLGRVSRAFPAQSRAMTLWILGGVQLTLALAHLFVGKISDRLGVEQAYWLPVGLVAMAGFLFLFYLPGERKRMGAPLHQIRLLE